MAIVKEIKRKTRTAFQIEYREGGRRKYLSLGSSYNKRDAQEIARYVDRIVRSRLVGAEVDVRTTSWLSSIPVDLQDRLSKAGLIELKSEPTLEDLFLTPIGRRNTTK